MTASATTHASNGSAGKNRSGRPAVVARASLTVSQARHGAIRDVGTPRCAGHRPSHESRRRHGRLELFLELSHDRAVVRNKPRVSEAHAAEAQRRTRAALFFRTRSGQTRWPSASVLSLHVGLAPGAVRRRARRGSGRTCSNDVQRALRDLQRQRLALQRQLVDFGGTLTEAEYGRKLKALEKAVRRKTPARAARNDGVVVRVEGADEGVGERPYGKPACLVVRRNKRGSLEEVTSMNVIVKITPNEHGTPRQARRCRATLRGRRPRRHETDRLLRLETTQWQRPHRHLPGSPIRSRGARRTFALLRPISDAGVPTRIRDLVLKVYADNETGSGKRIQHVSSSPTGRVQNNRIPIEASLMALSNRHPGATAMPLTPLAPSPGNDSELHELLTVEDVAALLKVSRSWVYEHTRSRGRREQSACRTSRSASTSGSTRGRFASSSCGDRRSPEPSAT